MDSMRRGGLLATMTVVATLTTTSASASPSRAPSPAEGTAAFGRALHQLYGDFRGYWTCFPPAILGRIDCLGEVHTGRRWHQVSASATRSNGVVWIGRVSGETWTRRWSPYSRHYIRRSHEQVPGVASVNSPAYDWGWLALGAKRLDDGQTRRVDAYDGNDNGMTHFVIFTCSRRAGLITCRNALGDAMRYRP